MKIQDQSKVEFSYVIEGMDGKVLDSSDETVPMDYIHGQEELPPKLEEAFTGMEKGAEAVVEFNPGEYCEDKDPEMIFTVPRTEFQEDLEIQVGEFLSITLEDDGAEDDATQAEAPKAEAWLDARVMEVNNEAVILDANHPLAGIPIRIRVKVLTVN